MTSATGGALNIFLFASVFLVSFFFFFPVCIVAATFSGL